MLDKGMYGEDEVRYQYKFKELIEELLSSANGKNLRLEHFISDERGNYSEDRINNLIDNIISCADPKPEGEERKFFEDYLYCSIRALTSDYTVYAENIYDNPAIGYEDGTFHNLVRSSYPEQDFYNVNKLPINAQLDLAMNEIYWFLTDDKDYDNVEKKYYKVHKDEWNHSELYDKMPEADEIFIDPYDSSDEEFYKQYEVEMERKLSEEKERFRKEMPYAMNYINRYRTLILSVGEYLNIKTFSQRIDSMIDTYLKKNGYSIYSNRDAFIDTCVYVKRAIKTIKRSQEK